MVRVDDWRRKRKGRGAGWSDVKGRIRREVGDAGMQQARNAGRTRAGTVRVGGGGGVGGCSSTSSGLLLNGDGWHGRWSRLRSRRMTARGQEPAQLATVF